MDLWATLAEHPNVTTLHAVGREGPVGRELPVILTPLAELDSLEHYIRLRQKESEIAISEEESPLCANEALQVWRESLRAV